MDAAAATYNKVITTSITTRNKVAAALTATSLNNVTCTTTYSVVA
jgi:hypothetical protein